MSMSIKKSYGIALKHLRTRSGYSRRKISKKTFVTIGTIYKIETGQCNPRLDTLEILCNFYGIKMTEYFRIVEELDTGTGTSPSSPLF
jgi:transcriptional regulator with XRE-family HTH domain